MSSQIGSGVHPFKWTPFMKRERGVVNGYTFLERCQSICVASQELYNILIVNWSCMQHQSHSTQISLGQLGINESEKEAFPKKKSMTTFRIRFDVAVTYGPNKLAQMVPIWLIVESFFDEPTEPIEKNTNLEIIKNLRFQLANHGHESSPQSPDNSSLPDKKPVVEATIHSQLHL